jgi:hypothetical protein
MKKKMLGTLDAWSMSRLSQRATDPASYIVDCQIYGLNHVFFPSLFMLTPYPIH